MYISKNIILNIINNKNIEKYFNETFNYCQVNNPKISFYSIEQIKKYSETTDIISYSGYYRFLSKKLYSEEIDFDETIERLLKYWKDKDKTNTVKNNEKEAKDYLYKKFLIDPIKGLKNEKKAKKKLIEKFPNYFVVEPNPEEDLKECYDFQIKNNINKISFQYKPITFFNGLKSGSTTYSLKK